MPCDSTLQELVALAQSLPASPSELGIHHLDLVICPWWKFALRLDLENQRDFFEDRQCVTADEAVTAMLDTGVTQSLADVFSEGVVERGQEQGLTTASGSTCFNPFLFGNTFGTRGEHNLDTGFIDPLPDENAFYRTVASFVATGKPGDLEAGRQATEQGSAVVTLEDFQAVATEFDRMQQCQVDIGLDTQDTPGFTFTISRIIALASGGNSEVGLKTLFDLFYKGKLDPSIIVPNSV